MSSKLSFQKERFLFQAVSALSLVAATACNAQTPAGQASVALPSVPLGNPGTTSHVGLVVGEWSTLAKTEGYPFSSYARFMLSNPGWPGELTMRKSAEAALKPGDATPQQIASFFRKFPPLTATAWLRFAEALDAMGARTEANDAARKSWATGALVPNDETRLTTRFGSALGLEDQDARMDSLLWARSSTAAGQQLARTSTAARAVFEARLAMQKKAPDAISFIGAADATGLGDPGYVYDKAQWYRAGAQGLTARMLMARPMSLRKPPQNPLPWLKLLLASAKDAAAAGQWQQAYDIARNADTTYTPGTVVRDRPIGERDVYTDLVWLGGQAALFYLGRPKDAIALFDRYGSGAKSPQVRSKGLYWAGRAAEAAGDRALANAKYTQAAEFFDQFHGQLATERLGLPLKVPALHRTIEISGAQRSAFQDKSVVKAMIYLGQTGRWSDQSLFIRTIAANVESDAEHVLATELAEKISRPDLSVMIGRSARANGFTDYVWSSFPRVQVPSDHAGNWTMIHAISRQESQFDRQITSHAGAKGLMQLMPGTARETAPRAGLEYNYSNLSDPLYNIALGSTYFGQLMDTYGGSYVLSVAAYNAGPGNVNKWLRANGDPRAGVDVLTWIEAIPLSETRNYVQRVLENAVVYDLLNPKRANIVSQTPLSAYLGKRTPG